MVRYVTVKTGKRGEIMTIQESGEMYLETLLILSKESALVRSVDIAKRMGFSKPSVSRALGLLKKAGYLSVGDDGAVRLTESGKAKAERVYERHTVLTEALVSLGVGRKAAEEDACKMEHYISDETFEAMKRHHAEFAGKDAGQAGEKKKR